MSPPCASLRRIIARIGERRFPHSLGPRGADISPSPVPDPVKHTADPANGTPENSIATIQTTHDSWLEPCLRATRVASNPPSSTTFTYATTLPGIVVTQAELVVLFRPAAEARTLLSAQTAHPNKRQLVNSRFYLSNSTYRSITRLEHLPTGPESSAYGPEASNFIRPISSSRGCRTFPEIFISQPYRQSRASDWSVSPTEK